MINKTNILGRLADEAGVKDAVHVATVTVRAAQAIDRGERCNLNEFNEAVPHPKGIGVADPWLKSEIIYTGQIFQLVLGQTEVPNVRHVWDHPTVKFDPPTREVKLPQYLVDMAKELGVTFKELMDAAENMVFNNKCTPYCGTKLEEECEDFEWSEFWSEWSRYTNHEFYNSGTECCPEYDYPDCPFYFK